MSKLPARVRVHIRDLIDDPKSELQKTLKSLNAVVGSSLTLEIAWEDIVRDLKPSFSDIDQLVPAVCSHIVLFITRLQTLIEQDEKFQDSLLEQSHLLSALAVVTQAGPKTASRIVNKKLTLLIPTTDDQGFRNAQSSVGNDLPDLFDGAPVGASIEEADDWDSVDVPVPVPSRTKSESKVSPAHHQDPPKARPLPSSKSLQRPEVLFANTLPAFLTIRGSHREVFIEGSHSPTISLISEYFKNFARKDMHDAQQASDYFFNEQH